MAKQLKFGREAKEALLEGSRTLTEAVAATLGPRGNNVAYQRPFGTPGVVHDGVTVAKEVSVADPFVNMGVELTKEAAIKTNDQAGDGTTTAIVLTDALLAEGTKLIAAGHNPMMLRRGIDWAVEEIVRQLRGMAKPVDGEEDIYQVAKVSAQDDEIGEVITNAIKKLGKDAVITVEESNGTAITVEYKDGMEFSQGYISPLFQTDPERGEAVVQDAHILITDKHLNDISQLVPFFQNLEKAEIKNNVVVIAGDVSGPVLGSFVVNRVQMGLNVLCVKAPSFGDKQRQVLEDIAALTGGQFIANDSGVKLENVDVTTALGHARRVVATKDNTTIVDGLGAEADVQTRVESIKNSMSKQISEFDMEWYEERLAKLTSGIAIISVGAPSEAEMKEKKERIIDAVSATKAAIEEGIVPGGETALLRAAYRMSHKEDWINGAEEQIGAKLVLDAIKQPFRRLMSNSGFDAGEKYAHLLLTPEDSAEGVDVIDGVVKDLVEAGVVDPVKVTRCALQNAASSAVMMMTTNVLIVDEPAKDAATA